MSHTRISQIEIECPTPLVFEPAPDGVTSIEGDIFAYGDLSVVEVIGWALSATPTPKQSVMRLNAMMHDAGITRVAADLLVDGQPVRVERRVGEPASQAVCASVVSDLGPMASLAGCSDLIRGLSAADYQKVQSLFQTMHRRLSPRYGGRIVVTRSAVKHVRDLAMPMGEEVLVRLALNWAIETALRPGLPFLFDHPTTMLDARSAALVEKHVLATCGQVIVAVKRPLAHTELRICPSVAA